MKHYTVKAATKRLADNISHFAADERGATAVEYALLASLIGVAIIVATQTLGGKIAEVFGGITNKLKAS